MVEEVAENYQFEATVGGFCQVSWGAMSPRAEISYTEKIQPLPLGSMKVNKDCQNVDLFELNFDDNFFFFLLTRLIVLSIAFFFLLVTSKIFLAPCPHISKVRLWKPHHPLSDHDNAIILQ